MQNISSNPYYTTTHVSDNKFCVSGCCTGFLTSKIHFCVFFCKTWFVHATNRAPRAVIFFCVLYLALGLKAELKETQGRWAITPHAPEGSRGKGTKFPPGWGRFDPKNRS